VKFSYVMLPDYPLTESLASIQLADELGFHAVYAADETWHKDLWLLFAAAADKTSNIRMGPSVSAVVLREPTLIAQAAATLVPKGGFSMFGKLIVVVVLAVGAYLLPQTRVFAPWILGRFTRVHPLLLIFSTLLGASLFGLIGMFLAAPITALAKETFLFTMERVKAKRGAANLSVSA